MSQTVKKVKELECFQRSKVLISSEHVASNLQRLLELRQAYANLKNEEEASQGVSMINNHIKEFLAIP